ncbi:unnamed protein product [Paramecium primaurelia]|uniref:Uncharacterized protein n=1 Tax=Paramecium primaurelia TaxID=5886 RepID=A0A8S1NHT3_PARPR|nr:unnamed protein product [Paramecium primaurelia]
MKYLKIDQMNYSCQIQVDNLYIIFKPIIKDNQDKELKHLNQLVASLKLEIFHLNLLYNQKKKINELKSNNQLIINDFNKQLKSILKSLIQNNIQKNKQEYKSQPNLLDIQIQRNKFLNLEQLVHKLFYYNKEK